MLASDLDSRDFAGAQNPNELLFVEFYNHTAEDTWTTEQKGIKAFKAECPFIRISIPGNQMLTVERPADGLDVKKYPRQWLNFQMQSGMIANAENVPGWSIDTWDELDSETVRQLKFLRFYTVEQLAGANDAQVQGIGMGGLKIRANAKRALAEKNNLVVSGEVQARDEKIANLAKENAEMREQMKQFMEMMKNKIPQNEPVVTVKRGRKPKMVEA